MDIILEIHYLPVIQYFSKFEKYDKILLDNLGMFKKQTYRNRCTVAGANNILDLIIPLKQGKTHSKTSEVEIDNSRKWQREHWHSLHSAYGNAPFFEHYAHYFESLYKKEYNQLWDFDLDLIRVCLKILKIPESKLALLSENSSNGAIDFREHIHPKERYRIQDNDFTPKPYMQVFSERTGFIPNLSIIDLIFNKGSL